MAETDDPTAGSHWLYRLSAEQWLLAADNEVRNARHAFESRQHRTGLTHARRGAGMAVNALLLQRENPDYGRSYMEHLQGLQRDPQVPEDIRAAATRLLTTPLRPTLVTIGRKEGAGSPEEAEPAARIVHYVRQQLSPP